MSIEKTKDERKNAIELDTLLREAEKARDMAYAPYSEFPVGAAILFDDSSIVSGCNVENSSFGLSLCAERTAMVSAVAKGKKQPVAIAIVGKEGVCCPPCGACRQFLAEFNRDMEIILLENNEVVVCSLSVLLPWQFMFNKGK